MPACAHITSIRPNSRTHASTAPRQSAMSATSPAKPAQRGPSAATAASSATAFRSIAITLAPSARNLVTMP